MARKKVTFEEVAADFAAVKDELGIEADLKPVKDDESKCVLVAGDSVEIESINQMKAGLGVLRTLARHQTKLLSA